MNSFEIQKTKEARDEMIALADTIYDILRKSGNGGSLSSKERRDLQSALRDAQNSAEALSATIGNR